MARRGRRRLARRYAPPRRVLQRRDPAAGRARGALSRYRRQRPHRTPYAGVAAALGEPLAPGAPTSLAVDPNYGQGEVAKGKGTLTRFRASREKPGSGANFSFRMSGRGRFPAAFIVNLRTPPAPGRSPADVLRRQTRRCASAAVRLRRAVAALARSQRPEERAHRRRA